MHNDAPAADQPAVDYESLKRDAVSRDEATRMRVAAGSGTPAELLFFLAADRSLGVRAAVAMNRATPCPADRQLVRDRDERVRLLLARKLAALTPGLDANDHGRLARHAWANLSVLVQDEAARVRAVVADLVKSLPDAPRDLVVKLAHDTDFTVSDPVLRLSPVLTQQDLLGLLACAPAPHTAQSIACRPHISEAVADAIARTADSAAIRCLLDNPAAAVRETTLDELIDRAGGEVSWHEPLVRRPSLSARNARLLSGMVAGRLMRVLAERADLDPTITRDLKERLRQRLDTADAAPGHGAAADPAAGDGRAPAAPDGHHQDQVIAALRSGQVDRVMALIASGASVSVATVQRAARLRSMKAVVSLVWKAALPARIAVPVQTLLCNAGPGAVLRPAADGDFPLSEEEMRWQVEFVTRGVD